ncbi:MAG: hypothetical protein C4520_03530 [Candidatus Abyssobacteria bacterium SURF_5]|uniref:Phage gp6-like head-tail connector protein n=1 Tax=Abyssobacteria bacterium (strain SURF_5) TaxID=2093360 RepID=A0A3A4PA03_ABYX5|nr:MAG: hypothetical protein C4520_03530 [Candidatus Abyssubacteria bacterium SURF_5]
MADLTTLANVKEHLDIESGETQFDQLLARMITASSRQIEAYCNRTFGITARTELYDGNASDILFLDHTPIVSVASVAIDEEAMAADEYKVYDDYVRLCSRLFTPGEQNVEIQYSAGFYDPAIESPPPDLEDACIQLVSFKYFMRGAEGITSRQVNKVTDNFASAAIPLSVALILDKYRRARVGAV